MAIKQLLSPIKFFRLISLLMTYIMGAALARYVEVIRSWSAFWTGAVFLACVVISFDYMQALSRVNEGQNRLEVASQTALQQIRIGLSVIAATLMTVAITNLVGWMVGGLIWQGVILLLVVIFTIGGVIILKGTSEAWQPFMPLLDAILVIVIPPAFGFFLQIEQLHHFLTMAVMGLLPLYLAFTLLSQLIQFGEDQRMERRTTVTAMGWEAAMVLQNTLILFGYLLFALVALLGMPWFVIWPVFLTYPLGLLEIWLMERVRKGQKPLWRIMQVTLGSAILLPLYLLSLAFWIH